LLGRALVERRKPVLGASVVEMKKSRIFPKNLE
jgi:hypothetical protein